MTVPTKLKRELASSPSTLNLADFLEVIEAEGYDDTEVRGLITALETAIGDEETEGTILYRIKALEDAEVTTPETPAAPNE